jgi:hypothetical protein
MSGTNAVAWAVGAATANSSLPSWPGYVFGAMALVGLYVLGASLGRAWPFHRLVVPPAEMLDDCIRRGREARENIVGEGTDPLQAARKASLWTLRTSILLHEYFPALADEFLLAAGDEEHFSGQALAVRTLAVKLDVLAKARKGLAS